MTNRELANDRLKRLRYAKGYSLQELANATGLSKGHMWEIEQSMEKLEAMSFCNLGKISAALGISIFDLMGAQTPLKKRPC